MMGLLSDQPKRDNTRLNKQHLDMFACLYKGYAARTTKTPVCYMFAELIKPRR